MFLDDTACNLASLNLMKFRDNDGAFNNKHFAQAVRIFILAQDIMVDKAHYPTSKIEENSRRFRPLGLGYSNLGAYLMSIGVPYDSDKGRNVAADITAQMTMEAYATSCQIAQVIGAFEGYNNNQVSMQEVVAHHRLHYPGRDFDAWDETLFHAEKHGFRNAQVTLLAPTGTISYLMDCTTTGIEPELSLFKTKKLVGGGELALECPVVEQALTNLGYAPTEINALLLWLQEHKSFDACELLRKKHLPVFDCALAAAPGGRELDWHAHVDMVAAVQPHLSGAVSKTVNLSHDATVKDVSEVFIHAWKKEVKAVALYRNGCKMSQPVTTQASPTLTTSPLRKKLKDHQTNQHRIKFKFGEIKGFMSVTPYEDTGMPGEIFVTLAKEGSTIGGLVDGWAIALSHCLQYGVPLRVLVDKFSHTKFEPSGYSADPDIRFAHSIYDAIVRKLAAVFLDGATGEESIETAVQRYTDAPVCTTCGAVMVNSGATCYKCDVCGSSSGCG